MKKLMILAASAAVLLSGCQKTYQADSPVSENGQDAIGFSTYTGREVTKATLGSGTSFKVSAYLKTGDPEVESAYYGDQLYTWDGSSFVSDPVHYWPASGTLDFYAVMPATYSGTGNPIAISNKTVSFTADGATDLSAVLLAGQSKPDSGNPTLTFGHKLTKVTIKAKGHDTNLKYVITSATLTAESENTYTYSSNSWDATSTVKKVYTVVGSSTTLAYEVTTATQIGASLYLLPVQSTTAETVKLTLTYSVYEKDAETSATDRLVAQLTKSIDLTSSATEGDNKWAMNKSLSYNLTLPISGSETQGDPSASEITFTATLTDWDADQEYLTSPLLSGKFTVNSSGKQVQFTAGNLYWNGSAFHIEANQTDYPTIWSTSHVGHFFWTKTAAASYAESYDDGTCLATDKFFADGSDADHKLTVDGQSGLYALAKDEWDHLINSRTNASSLRKSMVTVTNGVTSYDNCLIIAPDDYDFTTNPLSSSYTLEQVNASGLVCLPAAGYRNASSLDQSDPEEGHYWSTTSTDGPGAAYFLSFDNTASVSATSMYFRSFGNSVRLVATAQ